MLNLKKWNNPLLLFFIRRLKLNSEKEKFESLLSKLNSYEKANSWIVPDFGESYEITSYVIDEWNDKKFGKTLLKAQHDYRDGLERIQVFLHFPDYDGRKCQEIAFNECYITRDNKGNYNYESGSECGTTKRECEETYEEIERFFNRDVEGLKLCIHNYQEC